MCVFWVFFWGNLGFWGVKSPQEIAWISNTVEACIYFPAVTTYFTIIKSNGSILVLAEPVALVNQDLANAASTQNLLSDIPGIPSHKTSVILFPFKDLPISGRLEGLVIRNLSRTSYSPLNQAYFQWWIPGSTPDYYQLIWSTRLPAPTSSYVYKNVSSSNINLYNGNMFGIYFPKLDFDFLSNPNDTSDLVSVKVLNFTIVPNQTNSWPYPPAVEFLNVAISASLLVEFLEVIILPLGGYLIKLYSFPWIYTC